MSQPLLGLLFVLALGAMSQAPGVVAPGGQPGSVRFAVIGDAGTGASAQYGVSRQMTVARAAFPFEFVIMLGDNLYGRQDPRGFVDKFERPYADLLGAGVIFYAALGNHDDPASRFYPAYNMGGERYYTFARSKVRFFVLDTNLLDRKQIAWLEDVLSKSRDEWKICYFHHPLYSNAGRHGSHVDLRVMLEPLLVRHGVDVVFSGHDHVYERVKPQKGITYFVAGSSGQLRKGDMRASPMTAASFDQDQTFMLVEVAGAVMRFRTHSRTGAVVDSGEIAGAPAP